MVLKFLLNLLCSLPLFLGFILPCNPECKCLSLISKVSILILNNLSLIQQLITLDHIPPCVVNLIQFPIFNYPFSFANTLIDNLWSFPFEILHLLLCLTIHISLYLLIQIMTACFPLIKCLLPNLIGHKIEISFEHLLLVWLPLFFLSMVFNILESQVP